MRQIIYILMLALFSSVQLNSQDIIISEVMSRNDLSLMDLHGDHPDWLEITNYSEAYINLEDWGLSDNRDEPYKWIFPEVVLGPDESVIVYCSGKNLVNQLHTNFKIEGNGEAIYLTHQDGGLIHVFPATCIPVDQVAFWKAPLEAYFYSDNPTPGSANTEQAIFPCDDELILDNEAGWYNNSITINLVNTAQYNIHYTLDGSPPLEYSSIYVDEFTFDPKSWDENGISSIPTAEDWVEPEGPLPAAHVLRAASFYETCPVSEVYYRDVFCWQ